MRGRKPAQRHRVVDSLRRDIVSGRFAAGQQLPPRSELCASLGSSTVTVQRAVNQLAAEGFIVANGGVGTYVADLPPHLHCYALVFWSEPGLPEDRTLYIDTLEEAARRMVAEEGRNIRTFYGINQHTDGPDYCELYDLVRAHRVAGLVFANIPYRLHGSELLAQVDAPMVAFATHWDHPRGRIVQFEQTWTAQAAAYLKGRGRRRVAMISYSWTRDAQKAARAELIAQGFDCPEHWLQIAAPRRPGSAGGIARLLCSLPKGERPDALLVTEDNLVEDAAQGLMAAGVRVPEDLDVVAHANFPLLRPSPLPMRRFGYDLQEGLSQAFALVDRLRESKHATTPTLPLLWEKDAARGLNRTAPGRQHAPLSPVLA